MIITINDLRAAGVCGRGARPWAARNGINWTEFVTHGVEAEVLTATGDAFALKVVALAEASRPPRGE